MVVTQAGACQAQVAAASYRERFARTHILGIKGISRSTSEAHANVISGHRVSNTDRCSIKIAVRVVHLTASDRERQFLLINCRSTADDRAGTQSVIALVSAGQSKGTRTGKSGATGVQIGRFGDQIGRTHRDYILRAIAVNHPAQLIVDLIIT